jgi:antitoxin component of MazEF toxin-antitoxin module
MTVPQEFRKSLGIEPGDTVQLSLSGSDSFQVRVMPRLTLEEALERWSVDEPLDTKVLLEEAEQAAADEVIAKLHE